MARRSVAQKAETHERILGHASRAFRSHGATIGIGEVMKELGLTRGGFYRHFESKDDLLVRAVALSLDETAERFERAASSAAPGRRLEAIITSYLSVEHLLHPDAGCAIASLAADLGRQSLPVRKRLDTALRRYTERLSRYMPGETDDDRRKTFFVLFSGMAGALALLRATGDRKTRDAMLQVTRERYLATYARGAGNELL